jgi:hypothetical protein
MPGDGLRFVLEFLRLKVLSWFLLSKLRESLWFSEFFSDRNWFRISIIHSAFLDRSFSCEYIGSEIIIVNMKRQQ